MLAYLQTLPPYPGSAHFLNEPGDGQGQEEVDARYQLFSF